MWRAIYFSILFMARILRASASIQHVPIGCIVDQGAVEVKEQLTKMVEMSNRNNTNLRMIIGMNCNIVDLEDSFKLSTSICELLDHGVFMIIGGSSPKSFNVIQSYMHALRVPYLVYTPNRNQEHDEYNYDFSVSPVYIDAVIQMIEFLKWRKIYYLFDSDDGLWQLQRIYEYFKQPNALMIDARRLYDTVHAHDSLRRLDRVNKAERKCIVLNLSSAAVFQKILDQIVNVGMNRENYHYLLAGPNIDELDLRSFAYGGVNVTGFRLPLGDDPRATVFPQFQLKARNGRNTTTLPTDKAMALDGLETAIKALTELMNDPETRSIFKTTFRHRDFYNNDTKGIQCWAQPVMPWVHGPVVRKAVAEVKFEGLTGSVAYDESGLRRQHILEVMHMTFMNPLTKVGTWSMEAGLKSNLTGMKTNEKPLPANRTRIVTTILENPFLMLKCPPDGAPCTGNAKYEGYCMDLIDMVSKRVGFHFTMKEVADGMYGGRMPDGSWNGMIGELIRMEADMAVAALSISEMRERVVDFSKPFMDTGTSIMIKTPDKQQGGVFSFKSPLSDDVWVSIAFGFLAVSLVLFLVGRFSPFEWTAEQRKEEVRVEDDATFHEGEGEKHGSCDESSSNPFTLANTLWFTLGALMQQGSDISPRSISGRLVGCAWWFFTLIIISSYTANLAAFLTIERMDMPINSADDLVKQTEIRYGIVENGSTQEFFRESEVMVYKRMWNFMKEAEPSVFTKSVDEGVQRVREGKGKYAFLLDAAMNEYHNQRKPCNTVKVGRNLDVKGYGIATPLGSDLRSAINIAVLVLREVGELHKLERKWWYDKGQCVKNVKESKTSSLTLSNVSGIFHILIGGLVLAILVALLDHWIQSKLRARKISIICIANRVREYRERLREVTQRERHSRPHMANVVPGTNGTIRSHS